MSPADLSQLLQTALQLPAPLLQQLAQAPVVPLDLLLLVLVPAGSSVQPLAFLLRTQKQVLTWERGKARGMGTSISAATGGAKHYALHAGVNSNLRSATRAHSLSLVCFINKSTDENRTGRQAIFTAVSENAFGKCSYLSNEKREKGAKGAPSPGACRQRTRKHLPLFTSSCPLMMASFSCSIFILHDMIVHFCVQQQI